MEDENMGRIKNRVAIFVFSAAVALGFLGALPAMAYAAVPTISNLHMVSFDSTSGTYAFSLDADGNVYALLLPASGAGPSADDIASTGISLGSLTATDSPFSKTVTGLSSGQGYIVWMTTEDPADLGTYSTPVSVSFSTAVCVINNTHYYASLANALTAAASGDTITLLQDISEATPINVSGSDLTIDLAGHDLDLLSSDIHVGSGGTLTIKNGGTVTLSDGIHADAATVTVNADIESDLYGLYAQYGIYAQNASTVTVNGNINVFGYAPGVYASDPHTTVTVTGNISSITLSQGVDAENGSTVVVKGNISTDNGQGVYADNGSTVEVTGDINAAESPGVDAYHGSTVEVTGDINGREDGVYAEDAGTTVTMTGNITSVWDGVHASAGAEVTLKGNITCDSGTDDHDYENGGVYMDDGVNASSVGSVVTVYGNISVNATNACGVNTLRGPNEATINGKITVTGTGSVGVLANDGGKVTVNGTIDPDNYVGFWEYDASSNWNPFFLTQAQNDATSSKAGYLQYSWAATYGQNTFTSYIWVLESGQPIPIPPGSTLPPAGDTHALTGLALTLALSALATTGIALARRRTRKANTL